MNTVILVGNVVANAEQIVGTNGTAVTKFRLATNETWKDQEGNRKERAEFHRCVLFGKRGEAVGKYLTKGTKLVVTGSIRGSEYEKDGVKRWSTDIVVNDLEFAGGGAKSSDSTPKEDNDPNWSGEDPMAAGQWDGK